MILALAVLLTAVLPVVLYCLDTADQPQFMKRIIRLILRCLYGVRGAIKPPLGPLPSAEPSLSYRVRFAAWRRIAAIYDWSELPAEWRKQMLR